LNLLGKRISTDFKAKAAPDWLLRGTSPVGREFIMRHYHAYGGIKQPPIDQGIDDAFVGKASVFLSWCRHPLCQRGTNRRWSQGLKASGMLMVDGVLYLGVRNAHNAPACLVRGPRQNMAVGISLRIWIRLSVLF